MKKQIKRIKTHRCTQSNQKKSLKYLKNKQEKSCYLTTKGRLLTNRKQGDNLQHILLQPTISKQASKQEK